MYSGYELWIIFIVSLLPSNRHRQSNDDCLDGKRENYQSVVFCIVCNNCAQSNAHTHTHLNRPNSCLLVRFSFLGLFCYNLFVYVCFCFVRFSFFSTKPRDWLGRTSPKWPILCRVGRKTLINQSVIWFM